jgi:hypothetical protein
MKIGRLGSSALLAFFEEVRGIDVFELDFLDKAYLVEEVRTANTPAIDLRKPALMSAAAWSPARPCDRATDRVAAPGSAFGA